MLRILGVVMLALSLLGCVHAQTEDILYVRPVWGSPTTSGRVNPAHPTKEIAEILAEAGELIGYTLVSKNKQFGTITIDFVTPGPKDADGRSLINTRCVKAVRSTRDPAVLAHEIGHGLGLGHSFLPGNLMNPIMNEESLHLTAKQHAKMRTAYLKMKLCK